MVACPLPNQRRYSMRLVLRGERPGWLSPNFGLFASVIERHLGGLALPRDPGPLLVQWSAGYQAA
jgi:hypothetical protein